MEKLTKEQFFAHLDSLTILELSDYIKEFETRYGISAAAPVMMAGGAAPQAEAKPAEEKTSFNVIQLTSKVPWFHLGEGRPRIIEIAGSISLTSKLLRKPETRSMI